MSSSSTRSYVERGTQTAPLSVACNRCDADLPILVDSEPLHINLSPSHDTEATAGITQASVGKSKKGSYRVFSLPGHLKTEDAQVPGLRVVSMPKVYRTRDRVPEDYSFDGVGPCIERSEAFPSPREWVTWMGSPPKPIPALHGPPSLPYARCPSGAEGIMVESDDIAPAVWGLRAKPGHGSALSTSEFTKEHIFPSLSTNEPTAVTDIDFPQSSHFNEAIPDVSDARRSPQQFSSELMGFIAPSGLYSKVDLNECISNPSSRMDSADEVSFLSTPLYRRPEKDMGGARLESVESYMPAVCSSWSQSSDQAPALQLAPYTWPSPAQHEYPSIRKIPGSLTFNPSRLISEQRGNHTSWAHFPNDHSDIVSHPGHMPETKRETTTQPRLWGSLSRDEALMGQLFGLDLSGIPKPLVTYRSRFGDKHNRKERAPMLPASMQPVIEDNQAKSAEVRNYAKSLAGASEKENTQGKSGSKRKALRKFVD